MVEPIDYAIFQNHGYMGLYGGLDMRAIHGRKGLKKSQQILDHRAAPSLPRISSAPRRRRKSSVAKRSRARSAPTRRTARSARRSERRSRNSAARCPKASRRPRASRSSNPDNARISRSRSPTRASSEGANGQNRSDCRHLQARENAQVTGWPRVKLDDLADHVDYGVTASADFDRVGPKFLRITDIQDGNVDWATVAGRYYGGTGPQPYAGSPLLG